MPHKKKARSTGSWAGNRDKHQNLAKQGKEKKHSPPPPRTEGQNNYVPSKFRPR